MCDWLNSRAKDEGIAAAGTYGTAAIVKAAAAGEYLEALDRVLPETAGEFMHYIKMHASHDHGGFVERQLILVAARCLVFSNLNEFLLAKLHYNIVALNSANICLHFHFMLCALCVYVGFC